MASTSVNVGVQNQNDNVSSAANQKRIKALAQQLGINPQGKSYQNLMKEVTAASGGAFGYQANNQASLSQVGPMGGGYGGGYGEEAIKAYEDAYKKANEANESRYQDILGQYESRYGRNMAYIADQSTQQEMDARGYGSERKARGNQDLVSRGLTGTTIKPTMEMGYDRETDANVRRIQDAKLQQQLLADSRLTKDKLDFMERKTEAQPDMSRYAALMQQYGRYGGGGGGGYGGGGTTVRKVGGSKSSSKYKTSHGTSLWDDTKTGKGTTGRTGKSGDVYASGGDRGWYGYGGGGGYGDWVTPGQATSGVAIGTPLSNYQQAQAAVNPGWTNGYANPTMTPWGQRSTNQGGYGGSGLTSLF